MAVSNVTIFADKSKRETYDILFDDTQKSFVPTDLTILADHIFRSPVAELVYQRRPYSLVWGRRDDGRISCLSYNRQHDVLGWTQNLLGGTNASVKSIAVIPGNSDTGTQTNPSDERDELWAIVSRTIDSSTVQYIEVMEGFFDGVLREDYDDEDDWQAAMRTDQIDAIYLDSAITVVQSSSTAVSGLTHLEGETVKVFANGEVLGDETVSSGAITIDKASTTIQVGLSYKHRYESLKLTVGSGRAGTSINKTKIISGCGYIVLDTGKFKATTVRYDENGRKQHDLQSITFLKDGMDPSAATPLFSGEKTKNLEGTFSNDTRLYIESEEPLPFTILGLAPLVKGGNSPSHN